MKNLLSFCCMLAVLGVAFVSWAEEFHVSDITGFQNALSTAESNGDDDIIYVGAGTYNLTSMLHYSANDGDGSLTITAEDPNNRPVLDGQGNIEILNIDNDFNGDETGDDGNIITISYLTFQRGFNPSTHGLGGGLSIRVGAADVHIENCIFQNNVAEHEGGGAWISSKSGNLIMANNEFTNNTATEKGGGFSFDSHFLEGTGSGSATISGNTFNSNTVFSFTGSVGGGGFSALSPLGGFTITDNDFQNNSSSQMGGGALCGSWGALPITITGNTFTGNHAEGNRGGGLSTGFRGGDSVITVSNNVFLNNTAHDDGGGLSLRLLNNSQGAPCTGTANITNNVFVNNSADDNGGGFKLASTSGTLNVTNNTAYGNHATRYGGGLQTKLFNNDASLSIYNNIIFENTSGSGGDDIYVNSDAENDQGDGTGSPVALFNNDIGPNNNNFSGNSEDLVISNIGNYTQGSNIDSDPRLTSPGSGDVHLLEGSPCIDAGVNSAPAIPATDFENDPRIMDGNNDHNAIVDIGADEAGSYRVNPVPTLSEWGMILMTISLGLFALISLRKTSIICL